MTSITYIDQKGRTVAVNFFEFICSFEPKMPSQVVVRICSACQSLMQSIELPHATVLMLDESQLS